MYDAIETIEHKGHTIEIFPDTHEGDGPRDWDNLCELHCWHRNMNLGDENYYLDSVDEERKLKDVLKEAKKNRDIVLKLYIYQHSGVALSLDRTGQFCCPWDAGQVGYVIIRRKPALEEWGKKILSPKFRKKLISIAYGEIQTYNQYLCGDIYGYVIDDDEDSCWGYYGEEGKEQAITEAKGIIEHIVNEARTEHQEKLKAQIKHGTPLEKREPLTT